MVRLNGFLAVVVLLLVPALPRSAEAGGGEGHNYAFLVGCSKYAKAEFRELPYSANDVLGFRDALLQTGFDNEHILALHDGRQETRYRPLKAHILKELDIWLDGMRPQDTVVVALSGHGLQFKGDPVSYFVPVDGKLVDRSTLIALNGKDGLYQRLKTCKAKKKLLIVNACRNDPTNDPTAAVNKAQLVDEDRLDEVPEGIAAIYSCKAGQKSYYDPDRKLAIFFDHVIRAWKGEYQASGQVTLEGFFDKVQVKTKLDVHKIYGEGQNPVVLREYQGEWRIAKAALAQGPATIQAEVAELLRFSLAGDTKGGRAWLESTAAKRLPAWQEAANSGSVEAMFFLAKCLGEGTGLSKDDAEAVKWYRKAAEQGHAPAQNNLGASYNSGRGVVKDEAEALKWFRKAAAQGFAISQSNLGVMFRDGRGVVKDEAEAVRWFRKAADQGHTVGQNNLGWMYREGRGVVKDEAEAVRWFRKAADQGDADGQIDLGWMCENGRGVVKDEAEAVKWYRKAADQGDAIGQNNLGLMYEIGRGVVKDEAEAVKWYRKAAAQSFAKAQFNLAVMCENGSGVNKNVNEAVYWYGLARDGGHQAAAEALRRLGK